MDTKAVNQGTVIAKADNAVDYIIYIVDGTVSMSNGSLELTLKKGDFIGLIDINSGIHSFTYTASTPVQLMAFASRENLISNNFFSSRPENIRAIALSINRFIRDAYFVLDSNCSYGERLCEYVNTIYDSYCDYARQLHETVRGMADMEDAPEAVSLTYSQKSIYQLHSGALKTLSDKEESSKWCANGILPGYILHAVDDFHGVLSSIEYSSSVVEDCENILMNQSSDDLYDRLGELYLKAGDGHPLLKNISALMDKIYDYMSKNGQHSDMAVNRKEKVFSKASAISSSNDASSDNKSDSSAATQIIGSMNFILAFSKLPEETSSVIKSAVNLFKKVSDPYSTENDVRQIRKTIEDEFYKLYLAVFEQSLSAKEIPVLVKMFLNFGYLDEELAGVENAVQLYDICRTYKGSPDDGIFTGYEWLQAIFFGKREPSINEFDQSFEEYVKDQVDNGYIPVKDKNEFVKNRGQMVLFELQNMFRRASRMCSGQVLSFCPVLCDYQLIKSPQEDLVDTMKVVDAVKTIRNIDYGAFYRETVCVFSKKENIHDQVHVEIIPDFVLLPVVGSRGAMWQEIVGRDRLTPARMLLPVINIENMDKIMLRLIAEFRWEMCKRMQGSRWNDVTEPSLTSLYYDYLQFYRKNSEISTEQKEKIKTGLQRAKNNYKECFIYDYAEYIKFEAAGSPHLTKVARTILFAQCPFKKEIRNKLGENPIYSELAERYNVKLSQQLHRLDNIQKKLVSKGQKVPKELEREIAFYNM